METYAKIINGEIVFYTQPDWISGDASPVAISEGFKPVLRLTGTGGFYETETNIVIETPEPPPPPDWIYPSRLKRLTVNLGLLFHPQYGGIANVFAIYANMMQIPYENMGEGSFRYYLQEIATEHEALINALISAGAILETKPEEEGENETNL